MEPVYKLQDVPDLVPKNDAENVGHISDSVLGDNGTCPEVGEIQTPLEQENSEEIEGGKEPTITDNNKATPSATTNKNKIKVPDTSNNIMDTSEDDSVDAVQEINDELSSPDKNLILVVQG